MMMSSKPLTNVGNAEAAPDDATTTASSPTKALESQSSVESPSSVTGMWNRNSSSKTILAKLKEEKLQAQDQKIVQSSDDPSSSKVKLVDAAAEVADEADSSSITKYAHRTPLPVSASNSYCLPSMINVTAATTPSPPKEAKNKSPIFLRWEQMAAKNSSNNNNSNNNNSNASPSVETADSTKDEPTPSSPDIKVNDEDKYKSVEESLSPPAVAYTGKRWSPPKPRAIADEEMQNTLKEVTNKISPPVDIVKNKESQSVPLPSSATSKRWPPSNQPPADDGSLLEVNGDNTNDKEGNVESSLSPEAISYSGKRWSPPKLLPPDQQEKLSSTPTATKHEPINNVSLQKSSSPSGISKRWPPSKFPGNKEEEKKEEEPKMTTALTETTTVEISPTSEIVDEKPSPVVPTVDPSTNNKEGNVKSSSSYGISKRWPPSKIPANEVDTKIGTIKNDSQTVASSTSKEKQSATLTTVNNNENTKEGNSESSSTPLIAVANTYTGKRWAMTCEKSNKNTSTTTTASGSNKLKRRWPPTSQVDIDEELALETVKEGQASGGDRVSSEFRTLVEKLVLKVMPTEVDHVDELIEEYNGREAELLDILSSMQVVNNEDCGVAVRDDSGNDQSICSNTTEPASNKTKESLLNETSTVGRPFDEETAYAVIGDKEERSEDANGDEPRPGKQDRPKMCNRRTLIVVAITSCLFLSGVVLALGSTFGFDFFGGSDEKADSSAFISRDDSDLGIATGDISSATQVPTPSPNHIDTSMASTLTSCDSEENIQELGLTSLAASYPKIAIDGDQAIVASGSGYVAFFALDPDSNTWTRTALFGLLVNVGEISSVAIHGNTAVIGAPKATTDLSPYRDEPLETGAIFIYEKLDPTSSYSWEQKKGPYVPNEYKKGVIMDNYDDANFGTSVGVYDDLIVASAPPESNNRGSVTVFKRDTASNDWVQLERLLPPDSLTCGSIYFGYSVQINKEIVVASADCDVNVVLYQVDRSAGDDIQFINFQELKYVDAGYGAVSSITIGENHLAYSTVRGGLLTYQRESQEMKFVLSQELSFSSVSDPDPLYEYPLSSDEHTMALSVVNEVLLYTRNITSQKWMQESLVLPSDGNFAGYTAASAALSNGTLMLSDQFEVRIHDFTSCIIGSSLETAAAPTVDENPSPSPKTAGCFPLDIIVTLDEHPSDTRWEIIHQGESTEVVATSPVYNESMAFTQANKPVVCLPEGTYDFTIYDDYEGETSSDWFELSFRLAFDDKEVGSGTSFGRNKTVTFSTPNSEECYAIVIYLQFDMYPQDESWIITQEGAVVASSSPFAEGSTEDIQEICLPEGDYVFTIIDAYGDGLCCEWGEGGYSVGTVDQYIIAEGAEFGPSESREFTLPITP